MKLVEGQLIHRRYRLDRRLAQGGMGEVWKGHDIQLNRPVAIKALRDDQGQRRGQAAPSAGGSAQFRQSGAPEYRCVVRILRA